MYIYLRELKKTRVNGQRQNFEDIYLRLTSTTRIQ
jgi:hypothetical protein